MTRAGASNRLARSIVACAAVAIAPAAFAVSCGGAATGDLFGSGGAGGAGATTSHASTTASTTTSATTSTTTSTTTTSATTSTTSATTSTSTGGPICGDGVCSPGESATFCPQDCGPTSSTASTGAGGMDGGTCNHAPCDTGDKLDASCDACAAQVCAADAFCCTMNWDGQCVNEANQMCGACCGNGVCNNGETCTSCAADCGACPPPATCPHSVCLTGAALPTASCHDPCTTAVCAQKPACCGNASWDASCQNLAAQLCTGPDPCVSAVCAAMPSCCTQSWTQACVDLAKTTCSTGCDCAHDICQQGAALTAACSPCVKAVCAADAYCCMNAWDGYCTSEVEKVCGIPCN